MGSFRYDVCVVGGCGHVGLPLALAFAKAGLRVSVFAFRGPFDAGRALLRPRCRGGPEIARDICRGLTSPTYKGSRATRLAA